MKSEVRELRKGKKVPTVKGHWLWGSSMEFAKDPLAFIVKYSKIHGDTFYVNMRLSRFLMTSHPEAFKLLLQSNHKNYIKDKFYRKLKMALGEGLLMNEGESWMRQRRLAQPAFYKKRLEALFETMVDISEEYLQSLESHRGTGRAINITDEMYKVTSDIVVKTLLGADIREDIEEIQQTILKTQTYVVKHIRRPFLAFLAYFTGEHRQFLKDVSRFDKSIYNVIQSRKGSNKQHNDLLSMLMAARDAETGEPMTDKQLRDEVITIYVAGHETSSNALSWTWYLLTTHPEIYRKVKDEVVSKLGNSRPDHASIMSLTYTKQVIEESMRLFPPAWALGREAIEEDELLGVKIKKKDMIFLSIYELHRQEKYWPDPDKFDPDRFHPENSKDRSKFHYLPFGAGPRMCIGNHFAIMEILLLIAMMIRKFDFEILEGHPVVPEPLITLRPKYGVKLFVT